MTPGNDKPEVVTPVNVTPVSITPENGTPEVLTPVNVTPENDRPENVTPEILMSTKCGAGWTSFLFGIEERCLKYFGNFNYLMAIEKCAEVNATVPVVRTKEENDQLKAARKNDNPHLQWSWLGIERFDQCDKWYETDTNYRKKFKS